MNNSNVCCVPEIHLISSAPPRLLFNLSPHYFVLVLQLVMLLKRLGGLVSKNGCKMNQKCLSLGLFCSKFRASSISGKPGGKALKYLYSQNLLISGIPKLFLFFFLEQYWLCY
jgi:hypothetical protein